ncbi:MAG: DUF547 domain-containing protein [Flavobacteriaceae bacterium]
MKTLLTLLVLICNGIAYSQHTNTSSKLNHNNFNVLLQKHVSSTGNVSYKGFASDKEKLTTYLNHLSNNPPKLTWSKNEQLAYWMNTYNAFTIKLIIDNYPIKSIKHIKKPWDTKFIKIGHDYMSLNDIEHNILRKLNDPRIHFGINCASFSCPQLLNKAFTAASVHDDLDSLAHQFINDDNRNILSEDHIQLSKIFQWFSKDFKSEGTLIDYLNTYSDVKIYSNAKKSYLKYNWDLNE